jgi:signal transduction histidine kinase
MKFPTKRWSMNAYVLLWIILPLTLVILVTLIVGVIVYRHNMTRLILHRQYQVAQLAAAAVSISITEYANGIEASSMQSGLESGNVPVTGSQGEDASKVLALFSAGMMEANREGGLVGSEAALKVISEQNIASLFVFQQAQEQVSTAFSDYIPNGSGQGGFVIVAVPLRDPDEQVRRAAVGAIDLLADPFGGAIRNLNLGSEGYAYLVDQSGIILAHPDIDLVGKDFSDRPFINLATRKVTSGLLWLSADGREYVGASAPVPGTGWSLIVKEPLDIVLTPVRLYGAITLLVGAAAVTLVFLFVRVGTLRVTAPIQRLVDQTALLAAGEKIAANEQSRILEIDQLENALEQMSIQMANYRTGLRQYVGAMTRAQEQERLRIAHELHDETIQSLLTIARRVELYRAQEDDPGRSQQLEQLLEMINQSVNGVRHVSQDLRPLALDDLGLVPAIQMLVRAAHQGDGAVPHVNFSVEGEPTALLPDQELALYRIAQEALANIRKHANATALWVEIVFTEKRVLLKITDDGKGFTLPSTMNNLIQEGRLGLMGIQERAWSVEGQVKIETRPESGTRIMVSVPR